MVRVQEIMDNLKQTTLSGLEDVFEHVDDASEVDTGYLGISDYETLSRIDSKNHFSVRNSIGDIEQKVVQWMEQSDKAYIDGEGTIYKPDSIVISFSAESLYLEGEITQLELLRLIEDFSEFYEINVLEKDPKDNYAKLKVVFN